MVSFEIFVKAMPPSLSELKVLPSFCFAFKIPDDVAITSKYYISISFPVTLQKKLESTQEELMRTQIRYQKEIEKLENQNRELRKQLMLRGNMTLKQQRKIKKSLIDMYSEVLDQLSGMYKFRILEFSQCNIMLLC